MWVLKKLTADTTKYLVTEIGVYTIGRKNCNIILNDDSSISRKHCVIHVARKNECPFDVNTPTGVWLVDEQSKYGTFLKLDNNWVKLKPHENKKLTDRSIIRFGITENIWSLEYKPVIACTSGIKVDQKTDILRTLNQIDGELRNTCTKDCSLVVVNEITLTIKVVLALINGIPIVKTEYLKKLVDCIKNQSELPDYKDYKPEIKESILDSSNVSLDKNHTRKELFKGKTFVVPTKKQLETLKDVIVSAGGKIELFSPTADKDEFADDSIVLIQTPVNNPVGSDKISQSFKQTSAYLKSKFGKRIIPESEIAQAVAYSSTEKYCNPNSKCFSFNKTNKEQDLGVVIVEETPDVVEKIVPDARIIPSSATLDSQNESFLAKFDSHASSHTAKKRRHSPDIVEVDCGRKRVLGNDMVVSVRSSKETSSQDSSKKDETKSKQNKKLKNSRITNYFKERPKSDSKQSSIDDNEFWNCDSESNNILKRKLSTETNLEEESSKKKSKYQTEDVAEKQPASTKPNLEATESAVKIPTRVESRRNSLLCSARKIVADDEDQDLDGFIEKEKTESVCSGVDDLNNTIYSLTLISSAYLKEDGSLIDPPLQPVNVKKFRKQRVLPITSSLVEQVDDEVIGDDWIEPHPVGCHVSVSGVADW